MGGPMLLAEATYVTEGIRMIDVRPEQAAVFMALAYNWLRQEKPHDLLRRPMNIETVQH